MTITGMPTGLLDINSEAAPCQITIQFSASGNHLWIHMNGKSIVRIYGIGEVLIENARDDGMRMNLGWHV